MELTCALCKKNKADFYRLVPQLGRQVPVCVVCMSKLGKSSFSYDGGSSAGGGFGFDFFSSPIFSSLSPVNEADFIKDYFSQKSITPVCANCGFDFSEYSKKGRLGCSKCYDAFKTQLLPIIKQVHGTTKHNGSRPIRHGATEI